MNFSIFLAIVSIWAVKICSSHPITRSNTTVIRPGDYPYQGVIRFVSMGKVFLLCEGAIIDKKWILTAAGCVDKYESNQENIDVVAGITSTKDIESEPHAQVRKVSRIKISPLWVASEKKAGDIALIELFKPFTFNKFVNKAILGANATVNETVQLVGYGKSENLTTTELKIISKQECNLKTDDNTADLICARKNSSRYAFNDESFAGALLVNSTNSDSSRDKIVGIMSACKSRPSTSVAHHKNWIEKVTKIKSSNADDTNASDDSSEQESYASDDGGAPGESNNTKNGTSTPPSPSSYDDSSEDEVESSEEDETTTEDTTDSIDESSSDETSEETSTSSSTTEESDETEESESIESTTAEDTSTGSTEENDDEDSEEITTTSTESSEEESTETDESTESSTTATTSSPSTTQTSAPTPTTTTTSSSTTMNPTTTSTTTSRPTTAKTTTSATTAATTTSSPTSPTTTPTPATTTTEEEDSTDEYYDSSPDNRDQNSHNSFDKDNHDKINADDFAGSNAVTSNSAQPSNPSLISTMISKTNNLFNSIIKKFKTFFAV